MTAPNGRYPRVLNASGLSPAKVLFATLGQASSGSPGPADMYWQEDTRKWHMCNTSRISRSAPASDAGKKVRGRSYSGSSPTAAVHPPSWWMNDAGWLAGVHGCTPAKSAWHWRSNVERSVAPSTAPPEQPTSNAGSWQARKPWTPRWPQQQPSNLKAGQKTDGNPMSSQR